MRPLSTTSIGLPRRTARHPQRTQQLLSLFLLVSMLVSALPPASAQARTRSAPTHSTTPASPVAGLLSDAHAESAIQQPVAAARPLVPSGASWQYLVASTAPGGWRAASFDAAAWATGATPFDSTAADAATALRLPVGQSQTTPVAFLRQTFVVDDRAQYTSLLLRSLHLTDSIVSINGTEVFRSFRTLGSAAANDGKPDVTSKFSYEEASVAPNLLVRGTNVVAVELYQRARPHNGVRFDLELLGATGDLALDPTASVQPETAGTQSFQTQSLPTTPGVAGGFSSRACESQTQDVMLVIDRSGSMSGAPIADAKSAAKSFISQLNLAIDRVGLVSFADSAQLNYALTTNGGAVRSAIDSLIASGGTAIGAGISAAQGQLGGGTRPGARPIMVVLSDGVSGDDPIGPANAAKAAGTRIISIALGSADTATMSAIASSPGDYYYSPTSGGLSDNYLWAGENLRCGGEGFNPEPNHNPEPCPPASAGDPVSLTDGAWYISMPCLSLGGKGLPIKVGLQYNTRLWFEGRGASNVGRGWTFGYGRRLVYDAAAAKATLFLESGEKFTYPEPSSGVFTAPAGNFMGVTRNATTGEMTLTHRDGTRDVFRADGSLAYTQDRFGNQSLVNFDASTGLMTITNNRTNQALVLEHALATDPDTGTQVWKLQRIRDAASNGGTVRTVQLAYTGGRLTKIIDPAGAAYTFAYDAQGRITTAYDRNNDPAVVGAAAVAMVNTYVAATPYKVARQTLANGTTIDFNWATGSTEFGLAVTYNAGRADQRVVRYRHRSTGANTGSLTRVYTPNSTSAYTAMEYDSDGQLTRVVDQAGRRTDFRYNTSGDLTEVHAYKTPTTFDRTLMQYDSFGNRTRLEEPGGAVTRWTYDSTTGALLTHVREATINGVATTQTTTFQTNPYGQIMAVQLPDGTWNTQGYDGRGYPTVTIYDDNYGGNTGRLALSEATTYDWRGFLTGLTNIQGIQTSYEYAEDPATGKFGNIGWPSAAVLDVATGGRAIRTEYTYDRSGNLLREVQDAGTGRRNAVWQRSYVLSGVEGGYDVRELTNPLNQITRYQYTSYGDLRQLTEVNPRPGQVERTTTLEYTSEGWLKQVRLHDARVAETYAHNLLGETVAMTDATGVVTGYGYDMKGRLSFTTDQFIQDTNLARGKTPTQSSTTSGATLAVDGNGTTLAQTTQQWQPYWDLDLGAAHELSTIQVYGNASTTSKVYVFVSETPFTSLDPNVTRTQTAVNATYIEGAIGSPTAVAVNRAGRYVRIQMAESGVLGLYEVEVYGRTLLPATAQLTRYTYDANDRVTQATTRVSATTTRTVFERSYDGFNRLASERDGVANQTTYSYDNARNWITLATVGSNVAAEQVQTQRSYDRLGRMTQQIVDPGAGRKNLTTNHFYTAPGSTNRWHLQRIQDPRGFVTTHRYNSQALLAQTIDAQATPGVWTYEYDNLGATTRITPPTGAATSFVPDLLGRTGSLSRNGQTESWVYNADGTLASYTDFASQITSYTYDTTGRLTSLDRPGTNADAQFAYTANDLLQRATSKPDGVTDEATTYSYDPRNRLQTRARDGRNVSYGYNLDNTLQRLTYWTRGDVSYGYTNAAQASGVNPWAAGATSYTYRSTSLLRDVTRPAANGVKTTYGYDTAGRLTGMQHLRGTSTINNIQYQLDANGNRTQQTDINGTTTYTYDVLNRLTEAQYPPVSGGPPAAVEHLRYDAVGNRTARSGALAARWQMEGNVTDTSGNANTGSVTGAVAAAGRVGGALSFDGLDDGVQVAHSPSTALGQGGADFSVGFWINPQGPTGGWRTVMAKSGSYTERTLGIWLNTGDNRLYFATSTTANWNEGGYSAAQLPAGAWTHVTYVKHNNQVRLYLNGTLDSAINLTGTVVGNTGPLYIGNDLWHGPTAAVIDEIEIVHKGLSDAEVQTLVGVSTKAARWSLEGGAGADTSGNANTGTVVGAVAATGKVGGALSFDGVDDMVQVPHSASLALGQNGADFSVGFWINPRQGPTGVFRSVMHKGTVDTERTLGIWLGPNDNKLHFAISTTTNWNTYTNTTTDLPLNTWTHVAYVKSGSQVKLYLNGVLNATLPFSGTVVGNSGPLYIGKDPWYSGTNGLFDEIEVYQKALSDAEVRNEVVRTDHLTSYDASDRIAPNQGITHDLNGNLTRDVSGTTYAYDAANRLTRTVKGALTTDYFYDALGNLIRQRLTSGTNVTTITFMLDESGGLSRVLGDVRSDGSETLYAYGPDGLTARRDIATGADSLSYPLLDGVGSVRHWTAAGTGAVQQSITYDAWGVISHVAGTNPAGGAGLRNGPGFTGEQQRNDGTIHLRARVYQPELGRFLQRDSFAGFTHRTQSLNRYSYAENNPALYTDPSGHFAITLGGLALIAGAALTAPVSAPVAAISIVGAAVVGGGIGLYLNRPQGSEAPTPQPSPESSPSPTPTPAAPPAVDDASEQNPPPPPTPPRTNNCSCPDGDGGDDDEPVTYYRVQGGTPPAASRHLIHIDAAGGVRITRGTLNISAGSMEHARYFALERRPGAKIYAFDIPRWLDCMIQEFEQPQDGYKTNPNNQQRQAPKRVDPTTPGRSYELPEPWGRWLQEYAIPGSGRIITP